MKNLDILRAVGEVVYGKWWQQPMAEALEIHRRTIHRWLLEQYAVPDQIGNHDLLKTLDEMLTQHEKDVAATRRKLDRMMR